MVIGLLPVSLDTRKRRTSSDTTQLPAVEYGTPRPSNICNFVLLALLMILLSHCQLARSAVSAVISQRRQARPQQSTVFAVLNGTSSTDPEPAKFSCDPQNWANGQPTSEATANDIISIRISFSARATVELLLTCVAHDFLES